MQQASSGGHRCCGRWGKAGTVRAVRQILLILWDGLVDIEDDGTPAPDDADAAPVDDDVAADAVLPFTVLTRSWSWQCARCSAAGSYGTEVPVSISSLQTAMVESLVALVAVFADELAACDDFFLLLRLVR
uniref:Uncharacterized protein n=1 Tax=Anopheles merus TaxID=30066 RepID=A0A182V6N6_ANOME